MKIYRRVITITQRLNNIINIQKVSIQNIQQSLQIRYIIKKMLFNYINHQIVMDIFLPILKTG